MDENNFQLPVASLEVLVRIILGYFHAGANNEPVYVSTVAEGTGMKIPNVSGNNKFLQSVNILEKTGKGYQFTIIGTKLAQHLDYDKDSKNPDTKATWSDIVDSNEFLSRMNTAVRIRGNMESEAFARHIALTSGAPNKPQFMRGARAVIAILLIANKIIENEDGTIKPQNIDLSPPDDVEIQHAATSKSEEPAKISETPLEKLKICTHLSLLVHITPETIDGDLEELARKINILSRLIASNDILVEDNVELS